MTKFGMVTYAGRGVFLGAATPPSKAAGPSVPQIFGSSCKRAHGMKNSNQILRDNRKSQDTQSNRITADDLWWPPSGKWKSALLGRT